jgi:hypothetical protein
MKIQCRHPKCEKMVGPRGWFYCSDHEDAFNDHVFTIADPLAKSSSEFYVGRSSYPERRLLEHLVRFELDRMVILHWAADRRECDTLEEWLIRELEHHSKARNESAISYGRHTSPWNCVYIAFALKKGKMLPGDFIPVRDLQVKNRQWPIRGFPISPVYLHADVTSSRASSILETYRMSQTEE